MKILVFNVGNAACSLLVCPNGNSLMIDCGCHSNNCPIDTIIEMRKPDRWLSSMKNYVTYTGSSYPLTMLAVTHPDEDHIRNIEKLSITYPPYILSRRYVETYPYEISSKTDTSFTHYREKMCKQYRMPFTPPNWGFTWKEFSIPMEHLQNERIFARSSIMNNSSCVYIVEYAGYRVLFGGDMEKVGWDWLLAFDSDFVTEIRKGVHTFVVSHHGHKSGYSSTLAAIMPKPKICILSKASEFGEQTDVSSSYSSLAESHPVVAITSPQTIKDKKTLTTRDNGNIYIDVPNTGAPLIICDHF